jgi:integrase
LKRRPKREGSVPKRPKCWRHTEGDKGATVTVYERRSGGLLYARAFDPAHAGGKGRYVRRSLKHRDQERAKTYALDQAAKLRQGHSELAEGKTTLARLFALYQTHRTPRKSPGDQGEDRRRAQMFARILGARKDPHLISLGEWEAFIEARRCGVIAADGAPVAEGKFKPVRARTVHADCKWLRHVLNWGTKWRDGQGRYLLRENPARGYEAPTEKNPRRPVATTDRYEAIRAVSDNVMMDVRWNGHRHTDRSYLSELLDIAHGTGRRISAICALRYQDLQLERTESRPHGAICWPEDTDKMGRETIAPISIAVRAAIDRVLAKRPGLGAAYMFPSMKDPNTPLQYEVASEWLRRAERQAGVPKQSGSLWHAWRRGWVTSRKHLPDVDVAAAGGWKDVSTLRTCYQRPDEQTMLAVVEGGRELRERHA